MRRLIMVLLGILILIPAVVSFAGVCGDSNNDGNIDLLDILYLISYKFHDGPPPFCETVTDIDGNVYQTVTIGTQVWMAENLKVTHYRNGDPIPNVTDGGTWAGLTAGAYCNYNNDAGYDGTYGHLYNWYSINDSRNMAPAGWHMPSDAEWKQLEIYLGLSQAEADAEDWRGNDEGGKLKEVGTTHWWSPNTGATNESGFSALPGGVRHNLPVYDYMGIGAYFWSSTESGGSYVWYRHLGYNNSGVFRYYGHKVEGFSVRCVKD
jgi:uncharacterized protein (TIGR02145 family)